MQRVAGRVHELIRCSVGECSNARHRNMREGVMLLISQKADVYCVLTFLSFTITQDQRGAGPRGSCAAGTPAHASDITEDVLDKVGLSNFDNEDASLQ